MTRAKLRIATPDTDPEYISNYLRYVEARYDFEFTNDRDADFVFHSIGGYEVLKYPGVRIFVTGENVTPNFAISDYALAFDKLSFGDRYLWHPLIKLYREAYATLTRPRPAADQVLAGKDSFCAYVMSNTTDSAPERERIFDLLSAYKQVNSGGRWRNNIGGRVADKLAFQSRHKFVIAFENSSSAGYLTEKFAEAAAANAVPIYWGDPEIDQLFNPRAFVNCHDFPTLEAAVAEVQRLDQNPAAYRQMLAEPWFLDGVEPECLRDETIAAFLAHIFDQDPVAALRRNRSRWGLKMERNLYDMCHRPPRHAFKLLRRGWREFCHTFLPRRKKY
jgi:alpha(1,3/1,4) fucosyltransferase